ncbi:CDP-glycerol glycerophosphotransferase family protein [Leuconostoc mesenteroides]|uniref:CDP-glycerol glycerophosphotransferase family protein n=1 Tax=Leuconostoc mesenteroides TaxID=1245 RepID=UPI0038838C5A
MVSSSKKIIVFYDQNYIGNLKALFDSVVPAHPEWDVFWLVDSLHSIKHFPKSTNVIIRGQQQTDYVMRKCDFLFEDKFHMSYPRSLRKDTPIINLWHGVGLKNVELDNPITGSLSERVMARYIHSSYIYRRQTYFVSTSTFMTEHFEKSMILDHSKFIEVGMPRLDLVNRKPKKISDDDIILWAPTFRDTGDFETILPINRVESLLEVLSTNNLFMIFSPHPNMRKDDKFKQFVKLTKKSVNIKIVGEDEDIYDYLSNIKYSIIDYSSIFYDLVYLGFDKFIRYIPDYEEYSKMQVEIQKNYFSDTYGLVVRTIEQLLAKLGDINEVDLIDNEQKSIILKKYFNRQVTHPSQLIIENMAGIKKVTSHNVRGLYSFNANDLNPNKVGQLSINNKVIILHFDKNEKKINLTNISEFFIKSGETVTDFYKRIFYIELKKYEFDFWCHYGSNSSVDDIIPRRYGIQTNSYLGTLNQKKRVSLLQIFSPKRIGIYKDDRIFESSLENTPKILRNLFDLKIMIIKWLYWGKRP